MKHKSRLFCCTPWGEVYELPEGRHDQLVRFSHGPMTYIRSAATLPQVHARDKAEASVEFTYRRCLDEVLADIKRMFRNAPYPWQEREDRQRRPWRYR